MKKMFLLFVAASFLLISGCELPQSPAQQQERLQKDQEAAQNGLNRVITVYDQNGKIIKQYEGKVDIEFSDSKVKFDLNGKRVMIYNATVIAEEQ